MLRGLYGDEVVKVRYLKMCCEVPLTDANSILEHQLNKGSYKSSSPRPERYPVLSSRQNADIPQGYAPLPILYASNILGFEALAG